MAGNGQDLENEKLKNTVKNGANAIGGPIAGKAVDMAGKGGLVRGNQNLNRTGVPASRDDNSSQDLDENSSDDAENLENENEEDKSDDLSSSNNNSDIDTSNAKFNVEGIVGKGLSTKIKLIILAVVGGFFTLILVFMLIIGVSGSVGDAFKDFINGIFNFFTVSQEELEKSFYDTLKSVQYDKFKKENVCVDANLIISALTVESEFFNDDPNAINQTQDDPDAESTDPEGVGNALDYKRMKKQITLLAAMQIKHIVYGWDMSLPVHDSSHEGYCKHADDTVTMTPVDDNNRTNFLKVAIGNDMRNSTTADLVSQNDVTGIQALFLKKASEEKNYEYIFYQPSATKDTDGNEQCTAALPADKAELSIGEDSDILNTKEDGVFYWNLIHSFIPNYYKKYLPQEEGPERDRRIKEIADSVYYLYKDMGPSRECSNLTPISYDNSNLCPGGITVEGYGTIDLEDYVAGVVAHEAYLSEGMEALKAQAVAARTYAINRTNGCKVPIGNSAASQTFSANPPAVAIEAAQSTAGEVMKFNGNVFSAMYDSYCISDPDCPDSKKNEDGTYSVTYTKMPAGEKHLITLSDSAQFGRFVPGQGHAHGMSQLLSYQMAKEGKDYQEILHYFYSDGIVITKSMPTANPIPRGTEVIAGTVEEELIKNGHTLEEFNSSIFQAVAQTEWGTRNSVATAAVALISNFYDMTGKKLPYVWGGTRHPLYGAKGTWKSNVYTGEKDEEGNSIIAVAGDGLDCSGFVSWAMYNGGLQYDGAVSGTWSTKGVIHNWGPGVEYRDGKPGDLVSSPGHIQMIVAVDEDGYTIAHASSHKNGLTIYKTSFRSSENKNIVDMSAYFENHPKTSQSS